MKRKFPSVRLIYLFTLLNLCSFEVKSQQASPVAQSIIDSITNYDNRLPLEHLFLHLDRANYAVNDTIYLKAYLLNPQFKTSAKSGVVYVEFSNDQQKLIKRLTLPYIDGIISAAITLNEREFQDGNYTLRAFTKWMQNFDEHFIFTRSLIVGKPDLKSTWLTTSRVSVNEISGHTQVNLDLGIIDLKNEPIGLKNLNVTVFSGKKELFKNEVQTDAHGMLDLNFLIPQQTSAGDLRFYAEEISAKSLKESVSFPIEINRSAAIDLQFMPEGGNLVAGISSRLAFKALQEDGTGIEVVGAIIDPDGKEISQLKTVHAGMGSLEFMPVAGKKYTASLKLPDGSFKKYSLPDIKTTGTALKVTENGANIQIRVNASDDLSTGNRSFYMVGYSRGLVVMSAKVSLVDGAQMIRVPKIKFPTGIVDFILFNEAREPLNERLMFVDNHDELRIEIKSNQAAYRARDSVALEVLVKDKSGQPIMGSFSVSVTDDRQVLTNSSGSSNLATYMLLEAKLKGYVEDPGFYTGESDAAVSARDLLLLTQGWSNFDWKKVFDAPKAPLFNPEPKPVARGKVANVVNKGLSNVSVTLMGNKPMIVQQTITDKEGNFMFDNLPLADSTSYRLFAKNKKGQRFNVGIKMDEFVAPDFKLKQPVYQPWYHNSDSTLLRFAKANLKKQAFFNAMNGNMLKEVEITGLKKIRNSKNLNGSGVADQVLDEQDILAAGKVSLQTLLEKKVKGFIIKSVIRKNTLRSGTNSEAADLTTGEIDYFVVNKNVHFVFDGVYLDQLFEPINDGISTTPNGHYSFAKTYLDYYNVEDIAGIEVLLNKNYAYANKFGESNAAQPVTSMMVSNVANGSMTFNNAYIEITTKAGKGPFQANTPGTYFFTPPLMGWPKDFYRPRYTNKTVAAPDFRSTIHWDPRIITDAEGKATVSFYAGDNPSTYTVILQGIGENGELGYTTQKINFTLNQP